MLSVGERKTVAETVVAQLRRRLPAIVRVGSSVVPDAVELARHAQEIGVDGVSGLSPLGYDAVESLCGYYATPGDAAPDLPFFPCIYSGETNAFHLMKALLSLSNISGTRYTSPDLYELHKSAGLGDEGSTAFLPVAMISAHSWPCAGRAGASAHWAV